MNPPRVGFLRAIGAFSLSELTNGVSHPDFRGSRALTA
jgi:hypothetical protein